MKVAFLSPLPPARSGVAHYASMVLPELRRRIDVTAFGSLDGYRAEEFDLAIYQLGNNPHHEFAYAEAMRNPGVAVLHDLVLHHLIVEMTLARGDAEGYVAALRANHGEAGAAWARGRAAGLHSEMGNFLLPASLEVARKSRTVIVHNRWAAERLQSFGVKTPIHVVGHPYEPPPAEIPRFARNDGRVVGLFGFLTSAKRAEVVIEAFRRAREQDRSLELLIVGEPAPNIDMTAIAGEGVTMTGYVADDDFSRYYGAVDRLVNLRYPSAGETSGTLIRAFAAGKPVAVSDYAQFAELPDDCVVKIPFGETEVDALAAFFLRDLDARSIAAAQRRWLQEHANIENTVSGYLDALTLSGSQSGEEVGRRADEGVLPIFPTLLLADAAFTRDSAILTLRNDGPSTLRARVYGEPAYRLIVKLFNETGELADHWLQLGGDLHPGASCQFHVPLTGEARTLRIYHAMEGVAIVDPTPAAEVAIARV